MVECYKFNNRNWFYFDIEKKTIARFPTKSNLSEHGSDNSLYFGMIGNEEVTAVFEHIFELDTIDELNGKSYNMKCGNEDVQVVCNINAQGQIQVKITKDGTMGRLCNNYQFEIMQNIDFTQMLIVVDFTKNEIRFKNPKELEL